MEFTRTEIEWRRTKFSIRLVVWFSELPHSLASDWSAATSTGLSLVERDHSGPLIGGRVIETGNICPCRQDVRRTENTVNTE